MIRLLLISTILLGTSLVSHAQRWNVSGGIFYGTFSMKSMKEFQEAIRKGSNYPAKIVDNFPGYIGYHGQVSYSVSSRFDVGMRYQYTSTGGRVDYGDYSGQFGTDNLLHSNSLGISVAFAINKSVKWPIQFSFATGMARTELKIISYFRLFDTYDSDSFTTASTNYFFNPAFNFNRRLSDHFKAYASFGYEFQSHGYFEDTNLKAEWDGVRIGVGVTYVFGSKEKTVDN